jgi:glutamate synthase (NADPH/NADH) small chain
VRQFEIMPKPPETRSERTPWPLWPLQLRIESAHEEGGTREWSLNTLRFEGDADGNVARLHTTQVGPPPKFEPVAATETVIEADLVLLAMGFTGPVRNGMLEQLGVALDGRGNVATDAHCMTSVEGVFAAGDMRRGQSLVVWAISEGRTTAGYVNAFLSTAAKAVSA